VGQSTVISAAQHITTLHCRVVLLLLLLLLLLKS
jgi:hypothetical protein